MDQLIQTSHIKLGGDTGLSTKMNEWFQNKLNRFSERLDKALNHTLSPLIREANFSLASLELCAMNSQFTYEYSKAEGEDHESFMKRLRLRNLRRALDAAEWRHFEALSPN